MPVYKYISQFTEREVKQSAYGTKLGLPCRRYRFSVMKLKPGSVPTAG